MTGMPHCSPLRKRPTGPPAQRPRAMFRFYEELNDHLPPERRKTPVEHPLCGDPKVGSLIKAMGVPLREVDLILINGVPAGFEHPVGAGDFVSVYPVFERFDVTDLTLLPDRPLRRPRFLAAPSLESLARRLRRMGIDVRLADPDDEAGLSTVAGEHRIILTRDPIRRSAPEATHALRVRSADPDAQLQEVIDRLQLRPPGPTSYDMDEPTVDPIAQGSG